MAKGDLPESIDGVREGQRVDEVEGIDSASVPVEKTAIPRRRKSETVRNIYMRRDVHWWCVSDADFAVVGGFNWWATTFFSLAAFFLTWAIGFGFDLFMAQALDPSRVAFVTWLIFLCVITSFVFGVIGAVYVLLKRAHIKSIKDKSSPM